MSALFHKFQGQHIQIIHRSKSAQSLLFRNQHSFISTVVKPKVKGFICTTAHPIGCEANVESQINYVSSQPKKSSSKSDPPKNVLVIGSSTGYGLASRITAAFGYGANTLGIFFEKPAVGKRTASAGWYNAAAFQKFADQKGIYSKNINGDAFSNALKDRTIETIQSDFGDQSIDLVVGLSLHCSLCAVLSLKSILLISIQ